MNNNIKILICAILVIALVGIAYAGTSYATSPLTLEQILLTNENAKV